MRQPVKPGRARLRLLLESKRMLPHPFGTGPRRNDRSIVESSCENPDMMMLLIVDGATSF